MIIPMGGLFAGGKTDEFRRTSSISFFIYPSFLPLVCFPHTQNND